MFALFFGDFDWQITNVLCWGYWFFCVSMQLHLTSLSQHKWNNIHTSKSMQTQVLEFMLELNFVFFFFFFSKIWNEKNFSIHVKFIWHCRLYQQNKNIHVDSWMNTETTNLTTEYHKIHLCVLPSTVSIIYTQMRRWIVYMKIQCEWVSESIVLILCERVFHCVRIVRSLSDNTVRLLTHCSHTLHTHAHW